ncbi:acyl-CoA dehydrogenase family protein, partial [Nocardioides sp.]|uniref:acyl-CoA dehydrogenase family protein n=1 Tax=Nocardioides sp. TaxID=35761 RepID=UPI00273505F7
VATLVWSGTTGPATTEEPVRADGDTLTGTVANVLFGAQAEILLVAASTDNGVVLFEVDPAAVRIERTVAMDTTTQLATLTLDGAPATRLGGSADAALDRAHLVGAVGVACLQLGCAQRALDMTVAYTKERVQFGRPIGSFQALKHRMADLLVEVEMSRSAVWAASYAVATGAADAPTLVAATASYCGDALAHIASETVQLHGGIAITWEHDAQMVFKRAHALNQLFGLPHTHRAALIG